MPTNDQILKADHQKVVEIIQKYKNINLINCTGEPPDEYDIEYKLRGFTLTTDGKVVVSKRHRVKIKLPFGYPHFPPTIKPLSPIFHPEIDNFVVPIATYWEDNKSLPDLVLHIGNMICGATYNLESPFNEEAAEYYSRNLDTLPLDALQPVEKVKIPGPSPINFGCLAPLFKTVFLLVFLAMLGAGGLFFYEQLKLQQASSTLTKAEIYEVDKDFAKAQQTAQSALKNLNNFYLLVREQQELQAEIEAFLQSESLLQGLKGNIRYGDQYVSMESVQKIDYFKDLIVDARISANRKGIQQAIDTYEKALEYADTNQLAVETGELRKELAGIRLEVLTSAAEKAHNENNLSQAIEGFEAVLAFVDSQQEFLGETKELVEKTKHMLLTDQIAKFTQQAAKAEKEGDYATALQYHKDLVDVISKAESGDSDAMKNTLAESVRQVATLQEKLRIKNLQQWLLANYKEIFKAHYPSAIPSALRSPKVVFIKYDGAGTVFSLSCLERGQSSVVKLRLYYQHDQQTGRWSLYDGDV